MAKIPGADRLMRGLWGKVGLRATGVAEMSMDGGTSV